MDTKQLRQKILDLAIRGKLVPQDPNDEPASVLLERVKAEKERLIAEGKIKRSKKSAASSDKPHYPFEIPNTWVWTTLGELFILQAGKNITADKINYEKNDEYRYPCYGGNGIRGYVVHYNKSGKYPIVGRQGALCGNLNYVEGKFYATEHAVPVETFAETIPYLAFLFLKQINLNQYATATAQPGLSVNKILDVPIPLPPKEEQARIVQEVLRLEAIVESIETNKEELFKSLSKVKATILEYAISGKLVQQDPSDEPAEVLLKRVNPNAVVSADTSHYSIPNTWIWVKLSDIFEINPKNHNNDDEDDCGFVPMSYVQDGYSGEHTFEVRKWGKVKKGYSHFQNGDIGVAKISPCFENLKSTIFHSLPNNIGAGTTELVIMRGKEIFAPFFLYLFKSPWYISKGTVYFKGVVGQQRVSRDIFTSLEVPLPPLNEQKRISAKVDELFAVIDQIQQSLE